MKETTMIAIVAILTVAFGLGIYTMSTRGDIDSNGNPVTGNVIATTTSTLQLAAFDGQADTATQVATTGYYWVKSKGTEEFVYGGTLSLSASARVNIEDLSINDEVKMIAFDSTYDYGEEKTETVAALGKLVNLNVEKSSTSQEIAFFDENGDVISDPVGTGVTVGSSNYIFTGIRVKNTDDKSLWKTHLIGFDYAENTNISQVKVSGLTRFTESVRKSGAKSVEDWYLLDENLNDDKVSVKTGEVTIVTNGEDIASETVTVYVMDKAPYLTKENVLAFGFEDEANNPTDVGIADKTQAITLN